MVVAIGVCFGLSPIGGLAGVPAGLIALGVRKNAALSGAAFFVTAGAVGLVGLLECGTRRACGPDCRECSREELHSVRVDVECG